MSIGTLVAVAESTDRVLAAGRRLQDGRADPDRVSFATDLLADRLEQSLAIFGAVGTQGFDSVGEQEADSPEDELIVAASQLSMAGVALAADSLDGALDVDLDAALGDLVTTNNAVQRLVAPAAGQRFDSARAASVDLAAAIKGLRAATETTVENIATIGAKLCERVLKSLPEMIPFIQSTWDTIKATLNLEGLGDQLGRLAKLALRLMVAALDRLANLIPSTFIPAVRDRVQALLTRLDEQQPAVAVFGTVLDIDGINRGVSARLSRVGLDKAKLDKATGSLGALSEQYGRYMAAASRMANALNLLHKSSGLLSTFAPQIPAVTAGAHAVLLVAVVAISLDFLDTGTTVGIVRGVRITIADATE
ncbi:MAG: hypothetical protein QOH69_274 [Actinomycetota bacterium]|jgi:hypothetical protein|nr:hypothetical protein [Mycobacterium sp.]MDQ1545370.1 hypothetical protein [Actinomycetota bacterium]